MDAQFFYQTFYRWVDTPAGFLFISEGIIHSEVGALVLTLFTYYFKNCLLINLDSN